MLTNQSPFLNIKVGLSNYNFSDGMNLLKNMDMEMLHFLLTEGFKLAKIKYGCDNNIKEEFVYSLNISNDRINEMYAIIIMENIVGLLKLNATTQAYDDVISYEFFDIHSFLNQYQDISKKLKEIYFSFNKNLLN